MKHIFKFSIVLFVLSLGLFSCSSEPSLQQYFVDNSENADFVSLNVSSNILKLKEDDLSDTQKEALASLKKFNILAFKLSDNNFSTYEAEKGKVQEILKSDEYSKLINLNHQGKSGELVYLGNDQAIDEVIFFGKDDTKGFALVRVLGDNMNPAHMAKLMKALKDIDLDDEALSDLSQFFKDGA